MLHLRRPPAAQDQGSEVQVLALAAQWRLDPPLIASPCFRTPSRHGHHGADCGHHGRVRDELVEQPWVGFDYDFTVACPHCTRRNVVPAELHERATYGEAGLPRCQCGAELDVDNLPPVLRDLNDPALQDESVDQLIWYHTSTYQHWPDREAYRAHVLAGIATLSAPAYVQRQALEQRMALAVHAGTYESAIDNMLRRIGDEDLQGSAAPQYFLHRVGLRLAPGDLAPDISEDLADWVGQVPLSELHRRGGRAVRYVNIHEAHGSISLALDPALVASVSTIALPVESIATETPAATQATAAAAAELAALDAGRPDTTGIDPLLQRFPSAVRNRYPDPSDPERIRITEVLQQHTDWERRCAAIWETLVSVLENEYLPAVNAHIRERFERTLPPRAGNPADYHRQFRLTAALLARPQDVIAKLAKAPTRIISRSVSETPKSVDG